jgi:transcriptional regulator with XRE-family HTH domain
MTTIVKHRTTTVARIREQLAKEMARERTTSIACVACNGEGYIVRKAPVSQAEVAKATGMHQSTLSAFIKGHSNLSLEKGLAIIAWLDEQQERPNPDAPYDADEPRSPVVREQSRTRLAAMSQFASEAAAKAGIDAIHRPPVLRS